jgi:hypothetical protein
MRTKTASLAIAIAIIFAIFTSVDAAGIVGQQQGQGQLQGQDQVQVQGQAQGQLQGQSQKAIGVGIGIGGKGGDGGSAHNLGNNQTSTNKVDQTITTETEVNNPRHLPGIPLPGIPLMPSFYDDPDKLPDWRVSPVAGLIADIGGRVELQDLVRLSSSRVKIGDSLLRETVGEPKSVQFLAIADTSFQLMGNVTGYSESDKIDSHNCFASAVVYAARKGATHFILVKEGFRRAGTFYGWHIGLGGGVAGIAGDAGSSAGGGSASIGPGVTSAESSRVDRPFVTIKCYYKPQAQAVPK